jgi:hypothetical protein
MIGAFLEARNQGSIDDRWYDPTLLSAAQWLRDNNPYLSSYATILDTYVNANDLSQLPHPVWPIAEHIPEDHNHPPVNAHDVIVPMIFQQTSIVKTPIIPD